MIENIIIIAIVMLIVAFASGYIYKAKKRGQKCIGCPMSSTCESKNSPCECKNTK